MLVFAGGNKNMSRDKKVGLGTGAVFTGSRNPLVDLASIFRQQFYIMYAHAVLHTVRKPARCVPRRREETREAVYSAIQHTG